MHRPGFFPSLAIIFEYILIYLFCRPALTTVPQSVLKKRKAVERALACQAAMKDQKKKDLEATVKSFNQSAKTVTDTTRGFSIDVPEGWQRVEKEMNGRRFTFLMGPRVNNFQANLNILKDDAKGMDLDQYVDYSLKHMGAITPGNLKETDIDINGIKGKLVQYTMAYQSFNMQLGSYILPVSGGSVYIITTTELVADKLQFAELFDKTVHTFKVQ